MKNKKNTRLIKQVCIGAGAVLALILVSVILFYNYVQDHSRVLKKPGVNLDEDDIVFREHMINIAFLGFDRDEERDVYFDIYRPDTIIVASINLLSYEVNVVSIPRDSYVRIFGPGNIYDKINHAYMYGHHRPGIKDSHQNGINTTIETIEDFLGGIPIHYYIVLDMEGVAKIVDAIGGVYYDVDVRIYCGGGFLLVDSGYQLLNSGKLLYYVRDRSNPGGDIGRINRQQNLLLSCFTQFKEKGKLTQIPQIYSTLKESIETNLSFTQITSLSLLGKKVDPGKVKTFVFKGFDQYKPEGDLDIYYYVIDENNRVEIIKEAFGIEVGKRPQITLPGRRPPQGEDPDDDQKEIEEDPLPIEDPEEASDHPPEEPAS